MSAEATPTSTAALDTARAQTEARKAALLDELADLDRMLDWIGDGLEIARSIESRNGSEPAALPPAEPPAAKPPPSSSNGPRRRRPAPKQRRSGSGARSRELGERTRKAILTHVASNPGCTQSSVAAGVGIGQSKVSTHVAALVGDGKLRRERDGRAKRLYPGESSEEKKPAPPSLAPAKGKERPGPDGEREAEIYDALRERPLTVTGLAVKTKRSANDLAPICFRMHKRGVLERLDVKDPPVRYAIPAS